MTMRLYHNQPAGTVDRARELRRNASPAEKHLLRALKQAFPAMKWRHQVPIGPYYADFLSFGSKLVIEVDGASHAEAGGYDAARIRFIEAEGYRVIRIWNNEVMGNVEGVIETISLSHREREGARSAQPSGKGEGEL